MLGFNGENSFYRSTMLQTYCHPTYPISTTFTQKTTSLSLSRHSKLIELLVDVDWIADNKILFLSDTRRIDCFDIGTMGSDLITGPTTGI